MRGAIIALEGPSAVGKTTTARALAERLGVPYLDEAWRRLRPRPSLRFRSRGELLGLERRLLAEESRRFRQARRLAATRPAVIVDTGFFGPLSYSAGLAALSTRLDVRAPLAVDAVALLAEGQWGGADLTYYLDAPVGALDERQAGSPVTHPVDLAVRHRRVADTERALWTRGRRARARTVYAEAAPRSVAGAIARSVPPLRLPRSIPRGASDPAVVRALEFVAETLAMGGTAGPRRAPGNC